MNPSTNPSAIRSKSDITAALLRLMNDYSFYDITIKHILDEAQVARKTFYRNFTSKNDVLESYIDTLILKYVDKLIELERVSHVLHNPEHSDLSPDNILRIIFTLCLENKDFLICLHKNNLTHLLLDQMNSTISKVHPQVVPSDHYLFCGIAPEYSDYIISFNAGAIYGTINRWIENGMPKNTETIIKQLTCFLRNLTTR